MHVGVFLNVGQTFDNSWCCNILYLFIYVYKFTKILVSILNSTMSVLTARLSIHRGRIIGVYRLFAVAFPVSNNDVAVYICGRQYSCS